MQSGLFARVVQRQGWDVEVIESARQGEPETRNFADRDAAIAYAESLAPDWIELGEVVFATADVPQHHRWTTLRRTGHGKYVRSALVWGGGERKGGAEAQATPD
jgi:hypothetical protein